MNFELLNFNKKNKLHGYQEWYFNTEMIYQSDDFENTFIGFRGNFKNGIAYGYHERHQIKETLYWIS